MTMEVKRIATHKRPDGDAIASVWLAERYLFAAEVVEVVFLPRKMPAAGWPPVDCMVDVGNAHDPERLRFDHKPPAFADRNASCAAKLVWEHLTAKGQPVSHLARLVQAVHEGDSNPPRRLSPLLTKSRTDGFHAAFTRAQREDGVDDLALYRAMRQWLDAFAAKCRQPVAGQ
jgi:hypothetical protein